MKNDRSWLLTPIFSFEYLQDDPVLSFDLACETEVQWDGLNVQAMTLESQSWQVVGQVAIVLFM